MAKARQAASGPEDLKGSPTTRPLTEQQYISRRELARLLGIHPDTTKKWERQGIGPQSIKLGRGRQQVVRYKLSDVERWLAECGGEAVAS